MTPLRFAPEVFDELAEAVLWYEARKRGLGEDLLVEIEATLPVVADRPRSFPRLQDVDPNLGIRCAVVSPGCEQPLILRCERNCYSLSRLVRTNLRLGFWRAAAVLSALLFIAGGSVAGLLWWERLRNWQRAIAQPAGADPIVVLVLPFGSIAFPRSHSLEQMRTAIDDALFFPDTGLVMQWTPGCVTPKADSGDKELAAAVAGLSPAELVELKNALRSGVYRGLLESTTGECQRVKPRYGQSPIAYVCISLAKKRVVLMSRREFLEYERQHEDSLATEDRDAISAARAEGRLPYPVQPLRASDVAQGLALLLFVSAVPWVVYYSISWVVQGFAASKPAP